MKCKEPKTMKDVLETYDRKKCLKIFKKRNDFLFDKWGFVSISKEDIQRLRDDKEINLHKVFIGNLDNQLVLEGKKIKINNSIIFGDVAINFNESGVVEITECFIFGHLKINACGSCKVFIRDVRVDVVSLWGKISDFMIQSASVGTLMLSLADVFISRMICCRIQSFLFGKSRAMLKLKFMTHINVKNSLANKWINEWNGLPNLSSKHFNNLVVFETGAFDNLFDFLEKNDFCKSIEDYANLRYYKGMDGLSFWQKIVYILAGGMIRPMVIFIWFALILVLFFGIYYKILDLPFVDQCVDNGSELVCRNADWRESIYFSVITITTVGYGDITPCGYARFWASVEGILGILMGGSFLLALTRKYFSR